jgi:hypothetical protein
MSTFYVFQGNELDFLTITADSPEEAALLASRVGSLDRYESKSYNVIQSGPGSRDRIDVVPITHIAKRR